MAAPGQRRQHAHEWLRLGMGGPRRAVRHRCLARNGRGTAREIRACVAGRPFVLSHAQRETRCTHRPRVSFFAFLGECGGSKIGERQYGVRVYTHVCE
eukprot:6528603-Prymnesium_polylepis.1